MSASFRNGHPIRTISIAMTASFTSVVEIAQLCDLSASDSTRPARTSGFPPASVGTQHGWMNSLYSTPAIETSSTAVVRASSANGRG